MHTFRLANVYIGKIFDLSCLCALTFSLILLLHVLPGLSFFMFVTEAVHFIPESECVFLALSFPEITS